MKILRTQRGLLAAAQDPRAGITIIEVMVAAIVLVVAVGGLSSSVLSSMRLSQVNEETARAHDAARQMASALQVTPFAEIWSTYNADPADDPAGPGTAPGSNFAVNRLSLRPDDPDGMVGEIVFPTEEVGGELQLREDVEDADLGLPRDISGDGAIDALDHADDYLVLPVTVRLQWTGATGPRIHELHFLLLE